MKALLAIAMLTSCGTVELKDDAAQSFWRRFAAENPVGFTVAVLRLPDGPPLHLE